MTMPHPTATVGTIVTLVVVFVADRIGIAIFKRRNEAPEVLYRNRQVLGITLWTVCAVVLVFFWGRDLQDKGTFFGLLAAGLALAMKEPLLSIAGRISIFAARMYSVGDRIQLGELSGEVIGIGIFYTHMLEIGNWMQGDQMTGRTLVFSNSRIYQHAIFNYTQDFSFIWDQLILPITYDSDVAEATRILIEAGTRHTEQWMDLAQSQVQQMRQSFLVPKVNFAPTLFTQITSNYLQLTLRYIVSPRVRQVTASALWGDIFAALQKSPAVKIGSTTMDLTVHPPARTKQPESAASPAQ
jgi:small-conductance mechanosensitive channel